VQNVPLFAAWILPNAGYGRDRAAAVRANLTPGMPSGNGPAIEAAPPPLNCTKKSIDLTGIKKEPLSDAL
jgi:hypothetical protein